MHNDTNETLNIEIKNLTKSQKIAIEQMLHLWVVFGKQGTSRWVNFFADGDGNFHPKIKINGEDTKEQKAYFKPDILSYFNSNKSMFGREINEKCYMYNIDFDDVAWQLREGE